MGSLPFAEVYRRLRTGKSFLIILSVFIATWLGLDWVLDFDPDYTRINLILSTEASISVAMLLAAQEATDKLQHALDQQTHDIVEAIAKRMGIAEKELMERIDRC